MRTREEIWHDLVKAVGTENTEEVIYLVAETMLDIRDLLAAK